MKFAIAGGGIGGLATALALAREGIGSTVFEQASAFGEIGAGIQIGPNAFHCFDRMGVGDEARATAVYIEKLRLMDAVGGGEICHIPLDDRFRDWFKNPYAVVHRADLHGILLDACRRNESIELHTRSRVTGYRQDASGVRVEIEGKPEIEAAALVGADGLNSSIRAKVVGDDPPRVSGHTTYRSVIPTEQMPEDLRWNAATLWAGPKCHIVHYPLKGWKVFNLVVTYHNDVTEAAAGQPVSKDEVRQGFEHIHPRARQIINHGTDWKRWVLCDREPVTNWRDDRVVLLGDAAHPMLQYLAQGACMAMEDAVSLAAEVGVGGALEAAFERYQRRRIVRTTRVVYMSRLMGDYVYHADGALALLRNHELGKRSVEEWYGKLDWLYGPDVLSH